MGAYADMLVRTGNVSIWMAQQMLKDVQASQFARKPSFGGKAIDTNHPAFVYGHLALYPSGLINMIGDNPAAAVKPAGYEELFAAGKPCQDDPDGKIYPPMEEITAKFFSGYKSALDLLAGVSDEKLNSPNPREGRMKEMFPTVGGMVNFMLGQHIMLHMGQISAWRRCFGLGSAM